MARIADLGGQHIGDQGTRGGISVTSSSAACIASAAGCIREQWKGALTGSSMPRLAPFRLGRLDGPLDRRLVAADDHLAAAIVIGHRTTLALGGLGTGSHAPVRARCRAGPPSRRPQPAQPSASIGRAASEGARHRRLATTRRRRGPSIHRGNGRRHGRPSPDSDLPPSFSRIRTTARLTAIRAGCAFSVRIEVAIPGPSRISLDRDSASAPHRPPEDVAGRGKAAGQVGAHADGLGSLARKDEMPDSCGHFPPI